MSNVPYTKCEREARDMNVVFDYERGVSIDEIQQRNGMGRGDVYRRLRRNGIEPSRGNWLAALSKRRAAA